MKKLSLFSTSVALALATAVPHANGNRIDPPQVPANLEVPAGNKPYLIGQALGTQNYMCVQTATGFAWTFFGPQATLFGNHGQQLTTHFLSSNPTENGLARATWQHSRDTSSVWAAAIANSTDPNYVSPGAIPWLLLQAVGAQYGPDGGDKLTPTTFIQRVNTEGGIAPATGCAATTDIGKKALVPYTTDYVFYKAQNNN